MQDRGAGPALIRVRRGRAPRSRARRSGTARRLATIAAVAAAVLAVDQLTKAWALAALDGGRTVDLVWTLRLRLVFNRGSAFGLGADLAPLFAVAAVVIVVVLLRAGVAMRGRLANVAVALVVGGALGNLADRVFRRGEGLLGGAVVDFIDVQWWPVFNVADAAIVVGSVLLFSVVTREPQTAPGES